MVADGGEVPGRRNVPAGSRNQTLSCFVEGLPAGHCNMGGEPHPPLSLSQPVHKLPTPYLCALRLQEANNLPTEAIAEYHGVAVPDPEDVDGSDVSDEDESP
eukprot:scaffold191635_cov24-Tisochrysis_lutea.AAC.1